MRVLLADDELRVRSALRLLLEQTAGIEVVGEAGSGEGLAYFARATCPDVALLDWELAPEGGLPVLRALRATRPGLVIVALSSRPEAKQEALAAGADAFVDKSGTPEGVLSAIELGKDRARKRGAT